MTDTAHLTQALTESLRLSSYIRRNKIDLQLTQRVVNNKSMSLCVETSSACHGILIVSLVCPILLSET